MRFVRSNANIHSASVFCQLEKTQMPNAWWPNINEICDLLSTNVSASLHATPSIHHFNQMVPVVGNVFRSLSSHSDRELHNLCALKPFALCVRLWGLGPMNANVRVRVTHLNFPSPLTPSICRKMNVTSSELVSDTKGKWVFSLARWIDRKTTTSTSIIAIANRSSIRRRFEIWFYQTMTARLCIRRYEYIILFVICIERNEMMLSSAAFSSFLYAATHQ